MILRMTDHLSNLLAEAASRYPGCWERINSLRLARTSSLPPYCFVPLALAVDIVMNGKSMSNKEVLEQSVDIARLTALSTWRATQRLYNLIRLSFTN